MSYIRYLLFEQQYQPAALVAEAYLGTIKTPFARWTKRAVATKLGLIEQQQLARDQLIQLGQLPTDAADFSQKKLRQLAMR